MREPVTSAVQATAQRAGPVSAAQITDQAKGCRADAQAVRRLVRIDKVDCSSRGSVFDGLRMAADRDTRCDTSANHALSDTPLECRLLVRHGRWA